MNFFDNLNDTIRNTENSIVNLISTFAPWLAPLAPAFMTYQHAINKDTLNFPVFIALPVALVVEILGFSAVSTFMSFWFYNRRNRAENKKAPLTLIVIAFAFYLALILFSNVLLDAFPTETWTLITVRALYTLQTIPAALIVAVRTQHRDMISEITKEQNEKNANKQNQTPQNSPVPQDVPQQVKMSKLEKAYLFVSNHYSKTKTLPINQTIADEAGVSVGTAYKALAMYVVKNEEELLRVGAVKQEQVIKAHTYLGQSMNQEQQSVDPITTFIQSNGRFPNTEELEQMNISVDVAIRYIVENQEQLRNSNILDEDSIQQAIQRI